MTRGPVRRLVEADWSARLAQIDFAYSMDDLDIAGVPCVRYRTSRTDPVAPLLLYLHAGAYMAGSPRANAAAILPACHLSGCEAIGIDYALAPESQFPTQLEQIERVYLHLLDQGRGPLRTVLVGDSAGGGLALVSAGRWRRRALPQPAGVVSISGLLDGAAASDTHLSLRGSDPIFGGDSRAGVAAATAAYAPGADPLGADISPVYDDFVGAPPLLFQVGSRDVFLGDSVRTAERARQAGADVTLQVFDGMFHLFHMHWGLAEAIAAQKSVADFIRRVAV